MFSRRKSTLLVGAFLAIAAGACSDQSAPFDEGPPAAARIPGPDIMAVQNRHTPELMRRDGIIGTGIRVGEAGAQKIAVYAVSPSHAAAARIPARLDGYDVEVVVTGRIDAVTADDPQTKERPAPNGFSVGHYAITAGTIGARVKDAAGTIYILSNNHVLANSNSAAIGDAILQPGPYDGGTAADQIGTLSAFQPILMDGRDNTIDAAIALVDGADLLGTTPISVYGAPGTTIRDATLELPVQKFGRTTGHTHGKVTEVNVTVNVCYEPRGMFSCAKVAKFVNQIGIVGNAGEFSAGGDSGSLIVTDDANKYLVGLLYAGSGTRTLANPIRPVLEHFGVVIDSGSGTGTGGGTGGDTTAPVAAFSMSCNTKGTCSFTDQSTDNVGVTSWNWNLGNGITATGRTASRTYTAAGSYAVTLTVSDAVGLTNSLTKTVNCSVRGKQLRCS